MRCEITGLRSTHSSVQSLDFEDCRLQEIEWAPLMSNCAFPDPIHTLKECSLKYNTFTEMNFNRFDFSDGNEKMCIRDSCGRSPVQEYHFLYEQL